MGKHDQTTYTKEVSLKVQNAKKRDTGRNIARIDQEAMEELDIKTGDLIALIGQKESAAIAWPSYPQDNGLRIIRIDSRLKKNTGTKVDDIVKIRKVEGQYAKSIVLAPISVKIKSNPRFETFVKRKLHNYPVTTYDIVYISIGISREITFKVINLKPDGVCIIRPETTLSISEHITEDEERGVDYVTYEDVGNLHNEIQEIRTVIEYPLRHPSIFNQLGVRPHSGILLSGPSGYGKTLLARAVANETGAFLSYVSGSELVGKYQGETEKNLRNLFSEAKDKAPSIIIIDEIDSIAPRKELVAGRLEYRMVSQLLSLMDSYNRSGRVTVIGITNKMDALEPSLLNPGRFDKIIEFSLPNEKGREEIFRVHTRKMPLEKSVSIQELAKRAQDFSGADISAVCKEAAKFALERYLPQIDLDSELIDPELLEQIKIIPSDFDKAINIVLKNIKMRLNLMEKNKTKERNY
jgi:transitional endoplasmic reticulum ATPase